MKKKAVVEVQFNWVFVLIAGAMILMFFIVIINKQKTISNQKISVDILNSMDRIMSGQKASENRQDVIKIFGAKMEYSCGGCDCAFSLAGMPKDKGNLVIFAPSVVESDMLLTWTQSWNMPFRVTNFIYFSVPEIKYIFVDPPSYFERDFIEYLPVNLTVEVVDNINAIEYKGEKQIRLVVFDNADVKVPQSLAGMNDLTLSLLYINGVNSDTWPNGNAILEFYKKQGSVLINDDDEEGISNKYPVLGMETAFGALYTDSFQTFKCNMDDAMTRLELVAEVYKDRTAEFAFKTSEGDIHQACSGAYSTLAFSDYQQSLNSIDAGALFTSINTIQGNNDNAIALSCPKLY